MPVAKKNFKKVRHASIKDFQSTADYLTEVGRILLSTLDYRTTLQNIARLVVPSMADWCAINILQEDGEMEEIALVHEDSAHIDILNKLRELYPTDENTNGIYEVLRTKKSILMPQVSEDVLKAVAKDEKHLKMMVDLSLGAIMILPIVIDNEAVGTVTFAKEAPDTYSDEDLELAEVFATNAALAIRNSKLYQQATTENEERARVEEELRRSNTQMNIILQNAADAINVRDHKGTIIYANDLAARFNGYDSAAEMTGATINEVEQKLQMFEIKDENGQLLEMKDLPGLQVLRGNDNSRKVISSYDKETGETIWTIRKAQAVYNEEGNILYSVTVITDITESKEEEKRKDEFISIASHELKTPLTSVKAFTQLLEKHFSKTKDLKAKNYLRRINNQVNKLNQLVEDLLDVSKIQLGKLELKKEKIKLYDLVDETISDMKALAEDYDIRVEGNTNITVICDKYRISQVLSNLVNNAIKYSRNKKEIVVKINKSEDGKKTIVSVQDFGIGIPKEHVNELFQKFYRVEGHNQSNYGGLGIGLYISSEILKRHGETIWVESKPRKGSIFSFTLTNAR